jgi:hypothetical protein
VPGTSTGARSTEPIWARLRCHLWEPFVGAFVIWNLGFLVIGLALSGEAHSSAEASAEPAARALVVFGSMVIGLLAWVPAGIPLTVMSRVYRRTPKGKRKWFVLTVLSGVGALALAIHFWWVIYLISIGGLKPNGPDNPGWEGSKTLLLWGLATGPNSPLNK